MAEGFRCPACSATLEFEGTPIEKCRFCESNVIVPSGLTQSSDVFGDAGNVASGDLSSPAGKALKIGEIQRLLQSGQKIYAIKLFREAFGVGLKDAKDAVDRIEAGKSLDVSAMKIKAAPAGFQSNAQIVAEIQRLLQGENKIEAIKLFREMTGAGLKEAKDAVEAIGRGENIDISRTQIQTADPKLNYQINAQNSASGDSKIGVAIIMIILITGAVIGVFYFMSR